MSRSGLHAAVNMMSTGQTPSGDSAAVIRRVKEKEDYSVFVFVDGVAVLHFMTGWLMLG